MAYKDDNTASDNFKPVAKPNPNWKNILWREWKHCADPDYAKRLYQAIATGPSSWFYRLLTARQSRPYAAEVEASLHEACYKQWGGKYIWAKYLRRVEQAKNKNSPLQSLITDLEDWHWLKRFIARHVLLYRGSEAINHLLILTITPASPLQQTANWLIESICVETKERLAHDKGEQLCPDCLLRCSAHSINRSWLPDLEFYGCRACKRSYGLLSCPKGVVLILDTNQLESYKLIDGLLYANWLLIRHLVDFDSVEIITANDETIERFAVQIGNDTDPTRDPLYKHMQCVISPRCQASANTIHILKNTFGHIEVADE